MKLKIYRKRLLLRLEEKKMNDLPEILEGLFMIHKDNDVTRNIRMKVKDVVDILNNEDEIEIKIDKSLETLGEVADDPSVPQHTKMQIWSLVSLLETNK